MTLPAPVGRTTFLLGLSGLLPQAAALVVIVVLKGHFSYEIAATARFGATIYAGGILSFLGGIWWGFAMRRDDGQGALVGVSVVPSLVAIGCIGWAALTLPDGATAPMVILGIAILLTLVVDRRLVTTGDAPANWLWLRVPLSIGLGAMTIAGALVG